MPPSTEESARLADTGSPESLRILVVDDNVDASTTLAQSLAAEGHTTFIAHDGPAALTLVNAQSEPLDAFILDLGLPGMDGWELARRLKAQTSTAHSVLIALTGYGQQADRQRSASAGFQHHLVKPVDMDMLRSLLSHHARSAAEASR